MLEFNSWFFVLLANFLVLVYLLNVILFRPFLKVLKQREEAIDGSLEEARRMNEQRENALEQMKGEFAEAGLKARARFEELRQEGIGRQKDSLEKAGKEAADAIEKARAGIRAEAEKARAALRADVEKFSDEIVGKLVGV